jgi:4-hydroxy-2-oxoheptanedioate aldolase
MLAANRLATTLASGASPAVGVWQMLPGANVSRILARAGPDFVVVDCEHGNLDDKDMHDSVPAIAAAGSSPIVRMPDFQGWMVKRALDSGAHGIIVPLLRTADEARQLVQDAKFPPLGRRGYGSPFSMERFTRTPADPVPTPTEYLQQANDALLTIVQIETREALDSVDAIAAVPGIDVLFVGPFDLGNNIGHPVLDGVVPNELKVAIKTIAEAAKKAGKKVGMFSLSAEEGAAYCKMGFDMVSVAADAITLQYAMAATIQAARGSTINKE